MHLMAQHGVLSGDKDFVPIHKFHKSQQLAPKKFKLSVFFSVYPAFSILFHASSSKVVIPTIHRKIHPHSPPIVTLPQSISRSCSTPGNALLFEVFSFCRHACGVSSTVQLHSGLWQVAGDRGGFLCGVEGLRSVVQRCSRCLFLSFRVLMRSDFFCTVSIKASRSRPRSRFFRSIIQTDEQMLLPNAALLADSNGSGV